MRSASQTSSYSAYRYHLYSMQPYTGGSTIPTPTVVPHQISQVQIPPPPPPARNQNMSSGISQITTDNNVVHGGGTIMGGRSEQERLRSRNPNRNISTVRVIHRHEPRQIAGTKLLPMCQPSPIVGIAKRTPMRILVLQEETLFPLQSPIALLIYTRMMIRMNPHIMCQLYQ